MRRHRGASVWGMGAADEDETPLACIQQAIAARDLERAVQLASEHAMFGPEDERPLALVMLGDGLDLLGEPEEARTCYQAALWADPSAYDALFGLALLALDADVTADAQLFALHALRVALQTRGCDAAGAPLIVHLLRDLGAGGAAMEVARETGCDPARIADWLGERTI